MKKIFATIIVTALTVSSAMALDVDFNSIIVANSKAQSDLHLKIKQTVTASRLAVELKETKYIADHKETVFFRTKKDFLTFDKEKKLFKPSSIQGEKRLAQEFKDLE